MTAGHRPRLAPAAAQRGGHGASNRCGLESDHYRLESTKPDPQTVFNEPRGGTAELLLGEVDGSGRDQGLDGGVERV